MQITGIKTHVVQPHDSIFAFLDQYLPNIAEQSIIALTSKVVSTCEGRFIDKHSIDKYTLVQQQADAYFAKDQARFGVHLTIKNNRVIPCAGIDESNAADQYILYPENSQRSAEEIWAYLRTKHHIQHLGVIITDSAITPLRAGVTGVGIAWCGFEPLYDYTGRLDIFDRMLYMTKINLLDALSVPAVLVMGEGREQRPLAVITQAPHICFQTRTPSAEEKNAVVIAPQDDLFAPMFQHLPWIRRS